MSNKSLSLPFYIYLLGSLDGRLSTGRKRNLYHMLPRLDANSIRPGPTRPPRKLFGYPESIVPSSAVNPCPRLQVLPGRAVLITDFHGQGYFYLSLRLYFQHWFLPFLSNFIFLHFVACENQTKNLEPNFLKLILKKRSKTPWTKFFSRETFFFMFF